MSLRFDQEEDGTIVLVTDRQRDSLAQHGWLDAIPLLGLARRDYDGFYRIPLSSDAEELDQLVDRLNLIERPAAAELEALL